MFFFLLLQPFQDFPLEWNWKVLEKGLPDTVDYMFGVHVGYLFPGFWFWME